MKKLLVVIVILGVAYTLFASIHKIENDRMMVVEDIKSRQIVRTSRPVFRDFVFVWQGALPCSYSLFEIPLRRSVSCSVKIAIPGLTGLTEDYYFIQVPLRVVYRIDGKGFSDNTLLRENCRNLDAAVVKLFEDAIGNEFGKYTALVYQRDALAAQIVPLMNKIKRDLQPEFKGMGLALVSAGVPGSVLLPEFATYTEGLQHAAELRKLDKAMQKDLIEMRGTVEREKIKNEQFYSRLLEISRIIGKNPDMLQYIYIDKMAGNVKVILSSDNTGLPGFLENVKKQKKGKPRDVDNLR